MAGTTAAMMTIFTLGFDLVTLPGAHAAESDVTGVAAVEDRLIDTRAVASTSSGAVASAPTAPTPPHWTRHVWTVGGQAHLDRCKGAVKVTFGSGYSVIAEHNYCGGAWVLKVVKGHRVTLTGAATGTYRAATFKTVAVGASASVLAGMSTAKLVLQTCTASNKSLRLVGLERVAEPAPSPRAASNAAGTTATCDGRKATIVGTSRGDRITGTAGPDVIVALGGNDRIDGRGGADVICAGGGRDTVMGGGGRDAIWAGAGNDTVNGGSGDDRIYGGAGNDRLSGNAGNDRIYGGQGNDRMIGGSGRDFFDEGSGKNFVRS